MKHIIICDNQVKAEKYCERNGLPAIETIIIMFTGELSYVLEAIKHKLQPCVVHHLNHNFKFVVSDIGNLEFK